MIAPAYFPLTKSVKANDDSADRFVQVIEQLRQEQRRGDDRANFALMALSQMPRFMGVAFHAHLVGNPTPEKIVAGQWVLSAGSVS
jgi:hypothetical protein